MVKTTVKVDLALLEAHCFVVGVCRKKEGNQVHVLLDYRKIHSEIVTFKSRHSVF